MATHQNLRAVGVTTRAAAALTGLSRATAGRKPVTPLRATRMVPANRLSPAERKRVVTTLDSARFVDQPPLQVYAQLPAQHARAVRSTTNCRPGISLITNHRPAPRASKIMG